MRNTAIKIDFYFSKEEEKKHYLIVDTKLQVEQIKRKMEAKFNTPSII